MPRIEPLRLIAAARRIGETAAFRIAGRLFAALLVVVLALRLWELWRRDPIDFGKLDPGTFALAVLASAAAVTGYGLVWPYWLRRLGTRATASWIAIFFRGQLGKYMPGSVWQYAGRVGLARKRGVPAQRALTSVVAEVVFSAAAAALTGLLVLGPATAGLALAGAVTTGALVGAAAYGLRRSRPLLAAETRLVRMRIDIPSLTGALRAAPGAGILYVLVWVVYGLAFWLTARALFAVPLSEAPRYVGVFAVAWLVGLVAVFAPGGVGVREAAIVALLGSRLGQENALALAGVSRIVLTTVDLVAGAAAVFVPLLRRRDLRPLEARP